MIQSSPVAISTPTTPALTPAASPAQPTLEARPLDAVEFSNLMNQAPVQPASAAPAAGQVQGTGIATGAPIVEGIQNASNHLKTRISSIRELTSKSNFTGGAADLLRMQLEMVQLGFEIELTGKVVTRATQDIDQLSKLQ